MSRVGTLLATLYHFRCRRSPQIIAAELVGFLVAAGSGFSTDTLVTLTFGGQSLL